MSAIQTQHHPKLKRAVAVIAAALCCLAAAVLIARFLQPEKSTAAAATKTYGIAMGYEFVEQPIAKSKRQLADIKKAGFTDVRFVVAWHAVQPANQQTLSWQKYDQLFQAVQDAGLRPLAIISYTPRWARAPECADSADCHPANPQAFADFAAAVATRYQTKGLQRFEIWNEPNIRTFWKPAPSAEAYAALLKASYAGIKQANPRATVLIGGLSGVSVGNDTYIEPRDYLSQLYTQGIQGHHDGLAYHPYTFPYTPESANPANGWDKMARVTGSLRDIMRDHGEADKKIWVTEFGAPTNGPGTVALDESTRIVASTDHVSQGLQATIARQAVAQTTRHDWLEALYWYTWQDRGTDTTSNGDFFGLVDYKGNTKPAVYVFKQIAP